MSLNEKTKTVLRTGIYVRVSTDEQAQEGFSIRAQTDKLKAYSLLKDWEIYDIYSDEGISGKNIVDRPAINRLIDDIADGKVNNVLVFKVDRLTRSTKNLLELVELFEECGCAFNSLTESIDTDTPSGRMFLKIIGIFAEFERENLVSRLKLGFERKAKEGYTLANNIISYGYDKPKGQKIQTINIEEAKILKEIYSLYIDKNKSMTQIARILNQRKIPTKTNAPAWDVSTIKSILTNPTYIGKVRYSTEDPNRYFEAQGHHERLISDEQFYLAQEKIKNMPQISRTKRPKEEHYFCGVLTCSACGSKLTTHNYTVKTGEKKCTYRCFRNTTHKPAEITCKAPEISHEKVEKVFSEYIKNINDLTETDDINTDGNKAEKERELLEYIKNLEVKIINLQARKKSIMEQYVGEKITFEEYRGMLDVFNEKYQALEDELQRSRSQISEENEAPQILKEDIILNLKENWDCLTNNERMMFLQRFIKKITVTVEKEQAKSNIVRIDGIEFNTSFEPLDIDKKKSVKNTLRGR
jgi:site-specific DNA recombinase